MSERRQSNKWKGARGTDPSGVGEVAEEGGNWG